MEMSSVISRPFWIRPQPVQLTVSLHSQVAWGATFFYCDPIHSSLFMSESVFTWSSTPRHCTCHIVCIVHDTRHLKTNEHGWNTAQSRHNRSHLLKYVITIDTSMFLVSDIFGCLDILHGTDFHLRNAFYFWMHLWRDFWKMWILNPWLVKFINLLNKFDEFPFLMSLTIYVDCCMP